MPVFESSDSAVNHNEEKSVSSKLVAIGHYLTAHPRRGLTIGLEGDLGAGKTTWTRAVLQALGVQSLIKSPTYSLVETYDTMQGVAAHFDLYRMVTAEEWWERGLDEIAAGARLNLIEWPSKASGVLPPLDCFLHIIIPKTDLFVEVGRTVQISYPALSMISGADEMSVKRLNNEVGADGVVYFKMPSL
jgi:tRNA threonylcarbamoyladenosine biosynthesis protein TsaE